LPRQPIERQVLSQFENSSQPKMTIIKIALIVLSMTEMFNIVEPCFITNCPRGGKRSGSLQTNPLPVNELMASFEPFNKVIHQKLF
jgi:hypothetical protein